MFVLLISIFLSFTTRAQDTQMHLQSRFCHYAGYDFTGSYYSNSYDRPDIKGLISCNNRSKVDEQKIKLEYDNFKLKLGTLVDKMLAHDSCDPIKDLLREYKQNVKDHDGNVLKHIADRQMLLEETKAEMEVQRWFALMAAFNITCSGEEHRRETFIDLEMINNLLAPKQARKVQVIKDGEHIKDCSNVEARGDNDLSGFEVSLENAEGEMFTFFSDVYGIPDRVTIKGQSGELLYDTGCVAHGGEKGYLEIPIPKGQKKVIINIVNTCQNPIDKGGSHWELNLQCRSKKELESGVLGECLQGRQALIDLLKARVEHTKELLNAESHQLQCLFHLDDYVRKKLVGGGYIVVGKNNKNDNCQRSDEECEILRRMNIEKENPKKMGGFKEFEASKEARSENPEALLDDRVCGGRPDDKGSVLQVISWSYCVNAKQRLMNK